MMENKIIIDYWGDITCPFCYIGEQILQNALDSFEYSDRVEIRWRSCLLRGDWEVGKTITWREAVDQIKDPEDKEVLLKKEALLEKLSEQYGLHYNLPNAITHNSINAARFLKLANESGLAFELSKAFGKAFFEDGIDLSKLDNLRDISIATGLKAAEVDVLMNSDRYLASVKDDQEQAVHYAYNYVPTIYFNGEHMNEGLLNEKSIKEALDQTIKDIL